MERNVIKGMSLYESSNVSVFLRIEESAMSSLDFD